MDIDKIVAEVLKRIEERTGSVNTEISDDTREKVLIISREGSQGHYLSEKMNTLQSDYIADYAEGDCLKDGYRLVIIEDLDDSGLSKIASGIFDEPYLKAVNKAILEGREIFLNRDSLEIFKYRDSAPAAFFSFYQEKLEILKRWGIKTLSADGIVENLKARTGRNSQSREVYGKNLMKRVVTDRDIRETLEEGQKTITVLPSTIITDIAKETALKKGIDIVVCKE